MFKLAEKGNPAPKFNSAGFVAFVQLIHIIFLLSIVKVIFNIQLPILRNTYLIYKLLLIPVPLVWLIIINNYYKKRHKTLVKLYEGKKIVTLKNTVIIFSLLLVPLFTMTFFLKK